MNTIKGDKNILLTLIKQEGDCSHPAYIDCKDCPLLIIITNKINRAELNCLAHCSDDAIDSQNKYNTAIDIYFEKGYAEEDLVEYLL
jgi:hypothetical protein